MRAEITSVIMFALAVQISAQTPTPSARQKLPVIYAPKPDYSLEARSKPLEGRGRFLLHVKADGTVESVDVVKSTGHAELDQSGVAAFLKWRFRPGSVKKVEIPLEFTMAGYYQKKGKGSSAQ